MADISEPALADALHKLYLELRLATDEAIAALRPAIQGEAGDTEARAFREADRKVAALARHIAAIQDR